MGERAPWADVARDQEARHGNTGDAAAHTVSVENGLTKKLLAAAKLHHAQFFGRAGRRNPGRRFEAHAVALEEIDLFGFIVGEEIVEELFALRRECGDVSAKLRPHGAILFGSSDETFDAPRSKHGVEGGEVTQFHREAAGRAAHFFGDVDDERVALVQLSERKFAVEIQRDEEVLTGPFNGGRFGHAADVGNFRCVSEASLLSFPAARNLARWIGPSWVKF